MGTSKLSGKSNEMLGGGEGLPVMDCIPSRGGGVAVFLVASCYGNRDKLRQ